jgi:hypothetical protein
MIISEDVANQIVRNAIPNISEKKSVPLKTLNSFFPEIVSLFGSKKKYKSTDIVLQISQDKQPYIKFTEGYMGIRTPIELHIRNPRKKSIDIAVLYGVLDFDMSLKFAKRKRVIQGKVKNLELTLTEMKPLFKTKAKFEDVQESAELLS